MFLVFLDKTQTFGGFGSEQPSSLFVTLVYVFSVGLVLNLALFFYISLLALSHLFPHHHHTYLLYLVIIKYLPWILYLCGLYIAYVCTKAFQLSTIEAM